MTAIRTPSNAGTMTGSDLTGVQCHNLTVLFRVDRPADTKVSVRGTWWKCRCKCGSEIILPRNYIVREQTKDCGCRVRRSKPRTVKTEVKSGICRELAKETICKACKRKFDRLSPEWRYQANIGGKRRYFCSWACFRKTVYDEEGFRILGK